MAEMDRITADAEFDKLIDDWDLDVETDMDDPDSKSALEVQKAKIVKGLMSGKLTIDNEEVTINLRGGKTAVFKVPNGAAYMSLDRTKDRENIKKLHNFMAAMTGHTPSFFADMDGRDLKTCQAIVGLFMGG